MNRIIILFAIIMNFQNVHSQNNELSKDDKKSIKKMIREFEKKSIYKDSIDWESFEKQVWKSAEFSKDSAVITALTLNGEKHSMYYDQSLKKYLSPVGKDTYNYEEVQPFEADENLGYINLESFINSRTSLDETLKKGAEYINENLQNIKKEDSKNLKGWVIDLRKNNGGNMWPMLISLTPFLENKILGHFLIENKWQVWKKEENQIFDGSSNKTKKFIEEPIEYKLKNKNLKVAVLINNNTASSGEATAIALMSNPNIKFFGDETAGYTTSNNTIHLKNNDILIMTSGVMADHTKKEYWNGITPEFEISPKGDLKGRILEWFN
ncbi:S41 family peptidase [Salegentibacter sp. Hel_I_6]|uniref:S41 family peptidase n=1 Tax=Salegentibacter sp. Hel_I_6 TaxID=1250278 RepID=UPI00056387B2|nr:S41 family peptidase [Salegentibacter sp. Hel_I_6]